MDWGLIGLILSFSVIGYMYFKFSKKEKEKTNPDAWNVQDLLKYKEIKDDGIIQTHDGTYCVVLEVTPIPLKMKSQREKDSVWLVYLGFLNSIGLPTTLLVQSQYLDMSDYITDYQYAGQENELLTDELRASCEDVAQHLSIFSEKKTRDYKAYVIARFNPYEHDADGGVLGTGNATIDQVISKVRGNGSTSKITKEEAEDLAINTLNEMASLLYQEFDAIGSPVYKLNKLGVYNMVHEFLNRDLSPIQRFNEAYEAGSFAQTKDSKTVEMSESQRNKEDREFYQTAASHPQSERKEDVS